MHIHIPVTSTLEIHSHQVRFLELYRYAFRFRKGFRQRIVFHQPCPILTVEGNSTDRTDAFDVLFGHRYVLMLDRIELVSESTYVMHLLSLHQILESYPVV